MAACISCCDTEYSQITREDKSLMPPLKATDQERRDLLAYLSRLGGIPVGPLAHEPPPIPPRRSSRFSSRSPVSGQLTTATSARIVTASSNQINAQNVSRLKLQWSYSIPYPGLEMTPLVVGGVMYVTGPNQVCALDSQTGRQIWCYSQGSNSGRRHRRRCREGRESRSGDSGRSRLLRHRQRASDLPEPAHRRADVGRLHARDARAAMARPALRWLWATW